MKASRVHYSALLTIAIAMSPFSHTFAAAGCSVKAQTNQHPIKNLECLSLEDAFLLAVADGDLGHAQRLFSQGVQVNYQSENRDVIRYVNVRSDKLNRYIIGRGRYQFGSGTAYDIALSRGNTAMVKWLLMQNANPAAGYFKQRIEKTPFSQQYPARYLSLPYLERARIITVGEVLAAAVEENDYPMVVNLLRIEPRAIHFRHNQLLPMIIRLGKWKLAEAFLQYGADIGDLHQFVPMLHELLASQPTHYRMLETFMRHAQRHKHIDAFPLFMQALKKEDKRAMQLLVRYGTNINVKDKKPPLVLMAEREDVPMVTFLLKLGADPNLAYSGQYLIHRAVANKQMPLLQALVANRANVNVTDTLSRTPLQIAVHKAEEQFALLLINKGANIHVLDPGKNTPLHVAAKSGKQNTVKLLLQKGANIQQVNLAEETALLMAVQEEQLAVTKILVAAGANPNVRDRYKNSPLGVALGKKNLAYVEQLIRGKVNVNQLPGDSHTPLIVAVRQANIPLIQMLLNAGATQKATDASSKNTPLHFAVQKANLQIMKLLLSAKGDINKTNHSKQSALHLATEKTHQAMVRLLLQYKPKLDGRDSQGFTALHNSVFHGNASLVQQLVSAGSVVNSVNEYGESPLLTALIKRKTRIARILLDNGAAFNVATNQGKTPLDIALSRGLRGLSVLMRKKGAKTGIEMGTAGTLKVELIDSTLK